MIVTSDEKDAEHEHVFFDEEASFSGWSPRISEKEKKELLSPFSVKPEIDSDDFGEIRDIELPQEVLSAKSAKLLDIGFSEEKWEELDFYPLHEPFTYVEILREKNTFEKCYLWWGRN